ncbi:MULTISPECIES: prepilin peptidase [Azospira]|jgi:leader peptidase (prepilin peptidase) / N-methyltransferase|uniref:Prepilin leader peptidase/N-methyltransferase n=1 Tax=Azospira oryzae TaxID=146939 RepID=A0ABY0ILD1_9RHOO|nr:MULTISPECIES: A24 family peptidase [Azospira]MBP7490031.1 prepilin peptidase [Azospira sp.]RZT75986.1 type 4 prepilin peptidase 1 [Azospira oryzae]BBN89971.1 type 4 prepilin-like proteins leader peptide-processing enzyme [Azospira sp. I09]
MEFLLLESPALASAVAGILGLLVGSFLNVVIHRLPRMMERDWHLQCAELRGETAPEKERLSLAAPASRCPHCGHAIRAWENIPVLSFLLLKGRCSGCQAPISLRYPLVEAFTGLLSAFTVWHFGPTLAAAAALLLLWAMVALTGIDFDTQLLPDSITLPLVWLGLLFNISGTFTDISSAVIGAMVGYLSLWSVYWLFKLATGKEGMGYGDFKLLAAIGAWLGWQMLPLTILLSSLVGAVVGVALIVLARRGRNVPIPFGPYLAAAGLLALYWGQELTQSYLRLL